MRAGAGLALDGPGPGAIDDMEAALRRILDEASYREGARGIAAEVAELPPPATGVAMLEDISCG